MNHLELSAAVHELGVQYGSRDTHTSEELTNHGVTAEPYYFAQVWFSREEPQDVVCVMGNTAGEALENLRAGLHKRLVSKASAMHPMAGHAALLMAAEVQP